MNITSLVEHHKNHGRLATVTAVQPPGRFGALQFGENSSVDGFLEKPQEMAAGLMEASLSNQL